MSVLNCKDSQLAMIVGKYVFSGGCTDVIGGTMTAGVATNSVLITFAPAFISAPTVVASVYDGGGAALTASNYLISLSGVTVSNAFISTPSASGMVISIQAIGLCRL